MVRQCAVLAVVTFGTLSLAPSTAHPRAAIKVFENTGSPQGTYSVGWSTDSGSKTTNFIVMTQGHSVVTIIKGCAHFPEENHGSLKVAWASDERTAVVVHGGKWKPKGVFLLSLPKGLKPFQLNIGGRLEKDARSLAQRAAKQYFKAHRSTAVVEISGAKLAGIRKLELMFSMSVPKDESGRSFDGTLSYNVTSNRRGLTLKLISGKGQMKQ